MNIEKQIESLIEAIQQQYRNESLRYKKQKLLVRAHHLVRAMHPNSPSQRYTAHQKVVRAVLEGTETAYGLFNKDDETPVLDPSLTDDFTVNGKVIGHGNPADNPQKVITVRLPEGRLFNNDDGFGKAYFCLVQHEGELWLVRQSASRRNFWTARVLRVEGETAQIELMWKQELFKLCESAPYCEDEAANTDRYPVYENGAWKLKSTLIC